MEPAELIIRHFRSGHRCLRICTTEEAEASHAAVSAAMTLSLPVFAWTAVRGVHDGLIASSPGVPDTENAAAALFHLSRSAGPVMVVLFDVIPHLRQDARTLRALRELVGVVGEQGGLVLMIDHEADVPPVIRSHCAEIELALPDRESIERIVRTTLRETHRELQSRGLALDATLSREEFATILRNLQGLNARQIARIVREICTDDMRVSIEDLNRIIAIKRSMLRDGGALEAVEAPVRLGDIGGLTRLKRWLAAREPALRDGAEKHGLQAPRGVLLLGVQGAGKSLAAKAIATAWGRPILRLDAGALYDRYVGESEARLREALRQAEAMAPVVLWIDEIEKAFASAASTSSDGGLSRRMFGCLLTWMQEHRAPVFLAATANDIEALPPELLRKGRFDEIFFVDLPCAQARQEIVAIHLRRRGKNPADFDLAALADVAEGFSGAEIEQAIASSITEAFAAGTVFGTSAVETAMRSSPPLSVTMREKITALRQWAEGRCVPAD
jgi:SpoVK/Ycf46/Vps4 family AAA+-type ATPase